MDIQTSVIEAKKGPSSLIKLYKCDNSAISCVSKLLCTVYC